MLSLFLNVSVVILCAAKQLFHLCELQHYFTQYSGNSLLFPHLLHSMIPAYMLSTQMEYDIKKKKKTE